MHKGVSNFLTKLFIANNYSGGKKKVNFIYRGAEEITISKTSRLAGKIHKCRRAIKKDNAAKIFVFYDDLDRHFVHFVN